MSDDDIWDRKRGMYFDRQGVEISLREWVDLRDGEDTYIIVASNRVDDAYVSTVWLGIDHSYRPVGPASGPPVIFETMVFGGPLDRDQRRYTTEDEALEGHAEILEEVQAAAVTGSSREPDKGLIEQLIDALEAGDDAG